MKRLWIVALCGTTAGHVDAGNRLRPTRPPTPCSLPAYDYSIRDQSNPVSDTARGVLKQTRVIERYPGLVPAEGAPTVGLRVFQLNAPALQVDHCSIARSTFTLFEDGRWIAQFDARQDPATVAVQQQPRFVVFKRNQFIVTARGQAFAPEVDSAMTGVVGEPELFKVCLTPFWVERGEVQNIRISGVLKAEEMRGFEAIDQVVFDLRYR